MKTTMKAAILLLSGTIFFSQASLAGPKADRTGPPADPCKLVVTDPKAACTSEIGYAFDWLGNANAAGVFDTKNGEKNYIGLTCKLALSQAKMEDQKAEDAYYKLSDSEVKVDTLLDQGKLINTGDDQKEVIKQLQINLKKAADCAYKEAFE